MPLEAAKGGLVVAEWSGILNTTIRNYIREVENDVLRNRKILAKLNADGRISYNWSGEQAEWRIRYRRQALQGMADADTLTFARVNRWKRANLDWRGYAATDSVTKKEKEMNKSTEAIINRYTETTQLLLEDIEENFGDEFYIDGTAAGNEKRIHGIESFMGVVAGTSGSVIGTPVLQPSKTYAGLNTDLGSYGGSWNTTAPWPLGKGSAEYDFYSPLILDTTSSLATASGGWTAATNFALRGLEITRYGLINSQKNRSKRGQIDMILYDSMYYRQFLELLSAKERIVIQTNNKNTLRGLGFDDVVNFDGAEVTYEYGVLPKTGYGFNTQQMEIRSLQKQLFVPEGPDYDIASQSWRFSIDFYGNMVFRPRYFLKIAEFGTTGA